MNATVIGLAFGTALGFAAAFGGAGALLIVLVLGVLGGAAGHWLDGKLDLSALTARRQDADRGWR